MTPLQQRQLAFLEETASFYNLGNRCINDTGACVYYWEGKAGCAIGRHIQDKDLCRKLDTMNPPYSVGVSSDDVFHALPENLQELGQDFLVSVQGLHDVSVYWDKYGLSDVGQYIFNGIKEKILQA